MPLGDVRTRVLSTRIHNMPASYYLHNAFHRIILAPVLRHWAAGGGKTPSLHYVITALDVEKRKVWGVRYGARSRGRSSIDTLAFLSMRNARIEPTAAWAAASFPSASTRYSFNTSGARPMGEQWLGLGPLSNLST